MMRVKYADPVRIVTMEANVDQARRPNMVSASGVNCCVTPEQSRCQVPLGYWFS